LVSQAPNTHCVTIFTFSFVFINLRFMIFKWKMLPFYENSYQSMKCSNLCTVPFIQCPISEISHICNVSFMQFPISEISNLCNVPFMKYPMYAMSHLCHVPFMKYPMYAMSHLCHVPIMKYTIYEMSQLFNMSYLWSVPSTHEMSCLWYFICRMSQHRHNVGVVKSMKKLVVSS